jgi:hypothetical protein
VYRGAAPLAEEDAEPIRRQLIALAGRKEARVTEFTRERPTEWQPGRVTNPRTGFCFTHREAWLLICDALRDNCPIEEVELRHPPGHKAYAFTIALDPTRPKLYVKLQLGSGRIIGRSFHYSNTGSCS